MRLPVLLLVGAALLVAPAAIARSGATTVVGTVGPGFTITLTSATGKRVTRLTHGTVVFKIRDRSSDHDFHLHGKGVDRSTEVALKGSYTWKLTLKPGTYTYKCDPHEIVMHGSFKVV
jgi:plastocyanin